MGQQWTELTGLSPEGTPSLKTILHVRKEHFYFSECLLPLTHAPDLLTGKGLCKLYCVETSERLSRVLIGAEQEHWTSGQLAACPSILCA